MLLIYLFQPSLFSVRVGGGGEGMENESLGDIRYKYCVHQVSYL